MMDTERLAEIFEAVKVLPLQPGDMIVFRAPHKISDEMSASIKRALEAVFGAGRRVLVLSEGADIEIVRPEASEFGSLTTEGAITEEEADRLKAEFERRYRGATWPL